MYSCPSTWALIFIALSLASIPHAKGGDDFDNFVNPDPLPTHFAIDIDGTFYVEDPAVFKRNVAAFKWLRDNNVTPFFCTGRNLQSNRKLLGDDFFRETGYNGFPGVYSNGALVYDSDGKVIKMSRLSVDYLERVNQYLTSNNQEENALFLTDNGVFRLKELSDTGKRFVATKKLADPEELSFGQLKGKKVNSMFLFFTLPDELKDGVYHMEYLNLGFELFQISPLDCNKKVALEELLNKLQVDVKSCAFIGDNNNDVEVMEYCPNSFAVGNATDKAKEKAKWAIKKKHDEGAFEEVVKKMYGYDPDTKPKGSDVTPTTPQESTTLESSTTVVTPIVG